MSVLDELHAFHASDELIFLIDEIDDSELRAFARGLRRRAYSRADAQQVWDSFRVAVAPFSADHIILERLKSHVDLLD